jgi:ketosteroid isomerase-like protein
LGGTAGIEDALWRLGRLMYERDPAMADEFVADALLVGSEPGEIARGREAIRALIAAIHSKPYRVTWQWDRVDATVEGDLGWFYADGAVVIEDAGELRRLAYRLAGVLQQVDNIWRWRLFHGSEPRV